MVINKNATLFIYLSEKIQISNLNVHTRMAFIDQINQNVGIFIYNRDFLFIRGIIGSPKANNRFQIIPGQSKQSKSICLYGQRISTKSKM